VSRKKSRPAKLRPYVDCRCPVCGHANDDHTHADLSDMTPSAQSISVCLYCAAPAVFVVDRPGHFVLRELTEDEWAQLPGLTLQELAKAQQICREVQTRCAETSLLAL
jgi:hypothetical protein